MPDSPVLTDDDITTSWMRAGGDASPTELSADPDGTDGDGTDGTDGDSSDSDATDSDGTDTDGDTQDS